MVIMAIMAHKGKKSGAKDFIRCMLQQLGPAGKYRSWAIVYGILAWIVRDHRAAMQHRINKRDARCVEDCKEYS
jgi:hypothetical protein